MTDPLKNIVELKTKAKNRRDRKRYGIAIEILETAIKVGQSELNESENVSRNKKFALQLTDCYGMQGGIYRRWAIEDDMHTDSECYASEYMADSIRCYDKGYEEYEKQEIFGIVGSYNLVNRLVSRLLYDPTWHSSTTPQHSDLPNDVSPLNVNEELGRAKLVIQDQLRLTRSGDIWALADLALVTTLMGEENPESAYSEFLSASPPDYVIASACAALEPLARLEFDSVPHLKRNLKEIHAKLEARLKSM